MRKLSRIFAVSVLMVFAVCNAHAKIISDSALNTRLGTTANLATVANTGSYNDLSNKPTIASSYVASGEGATAGTAITTVAAAQQIAAAVAESGYQPKLGFTPENVSNKITTIKAVDSASDAAYPSEKAVATALATKQPNLIGSGAGQNIKTINDTSLLGTGKIEVLDGVSAATGDGNVVTAVEKNGTNVKVTKGLTAVTTVQDATGTSGNVITGIAQDGATVTVTKGNMLSGVTGGAAAEGKVATSVTKSGNNVAVTMDYIKVPVGSATAPTSVASIWVE